MKKQLPIGEFRNLGYVQEINRTMLHPVGLALEVTVSTAPVAHIALTTQSAETLLALLEVIPPAVAMKAKVTADDLEDLRQRILDAQEEAKREWLSGVWDCRDDPEGIMFDPALIDPEKQRGVRQIQSARFDARYQALGYFVQPVPVRPA